ARAIGAGLVFWPVAALADPVMRAAGFALIQFAAWALADADIADGLNGGGLPALTRFDGGGDGLRRSRRCQSARAFLVCWRYRRRRRVRAMAHSRGVASAKSGRTITSWNYDLPLFS